MQSHQTFEQDCMELLRTQTEGRTFDRRAFLSALAILGVAPELFRLSCVRAIEEIVAEFRR
jgi:hypothetical protein